MDEAGRPLGGYAALTAVYLTATGAFAWWFARSGRRPPERVNAQDLIVLTVATHKGARLITKAKVTGTVREPFTEHEGSGDLPGEVSDVATGRGLQRAIGELLTCPYCISLWIATALVAGLLVAPRATRIVAAVLSALFGADVLQLAYRRFAG